MLKISRPTVMLTLALMTLAASMKGQTKRAELVIRDVSVLNPTGTGWLEHRDLVVRGTTIDVIQSAGEAVPDAKFLINGRGKFLIPALFDNGVSIRRVSPEVAGVFIANGITSLVDIDRDESRRATWRSAVNNGTMMGPRIVDGANATPLPSSSTLDGTIAPDALHRTLLVLEQRGARPADVLRLATLDSARAHGRSNDLGSIEPGKIADMVVLDADPLQTIRHTRDIDAVVYRGEVLTRAHLNQLIDRAKAAMR